MPTPRPIIETSIGVIVLKSVIGGADEEQHEGRADGDDREHDRDDGRDERAEDEQQHDERRQQAERLARALLDRRLLRVAVELGLDAGAGDVRAHGLLEVDDLRARDVEARAVEARLRVGDAALVGEATLRERVVDLDHAGLAVLRAEALRGLERLGDRRLPLGRVEPLACRRCEDHVSVAPLRVTNFLSIRSWPFWTSEPGILNSSRSLPPKATTEPTSTTRMAIQAPTTRHGCDAHMRAQRASAPVGTRSDARRWDKGVSRWGGCLGSRRAVGCEAGPGASRPVSAGGSRRQVRLTALAARGHRTSSGSRPRGERRDRGQDQREAERLDAARAARRGGARRARRRWPRPVRRARRRPRRCRSGRSRRSRAGRRRRARRSRARSGARRAAAAGRGTRRAPAGSAPRGRAGARRGRGRRRRRSPRRARRRRGRCRSRRPRRWPRRSRAAAWLGRRLAAASATPRVTSTTPPEAIASSVAVDARRVSPARTPSTAIVTPWQAMIGETTLSAPSR